MTEKPQFRFSSATVVAAYDKFLVPRLFIPWGKKLLEKMALQPGERLLDIACGPGTLSRLASEGLGASGYILAADISPAMIAIAKEKTNSPGATIEYVESPAAPLNAPSGAFDVVVCQQGLQFFPEQAEAMQEMKRALKPGGRIGIAVWTGMDQNPLFHIYLTALNAIEAPDEIVKMVPAPFSFGPASKLTELFQQAGFSDLTISTESLPLTFEGGIEQVIESVAATPFSPLIYELPAIQKDAFFSHLRESLKKYVVGDAVVTPMVSYIALARG